MNTKTKFSMIALLIPALLAGCSGISASITTPGQAFAQIGSAVQAAPAAFVAQQAPAQSASPIASSGSLADFQNTLEQIYMQVNPSVVSLDVTSTASAASSRQRNSFGFSGSAIQEALGSGFVWDMQGHIVTNNHVVEGANQIQVTFADGTTASAKVVGTDPNADLAVIQVNVPSSELHPVQVADSTQVKVGQVVIAIGNPFGEANSMSSGIVSALQRSLPVTSSNTANQGQSLTQSQSQGTYAIPDVIQTDASINPGNSGGVLVDDQGRLIGVTAAIESASQSNSGVGFVIPSAIVQKVVPSLISTGKFEHPWLGVSGTDLTASLATAMGLDANQRGALILSLDPGGPAAKAGLQGGNQTATINGQQAQVGGDVITAIDGQPIRTFGDVGSYLIEHAAVGQTITVTVLRGGKQANVQLTLGALPAQ